jgi:DNA-directed RNA polymerase specialized sigma24 family protein
MHLVLMTSSAPLMPVTGDSRRAVAIAWKRYAPSLKCVARRMTEDRDERRDLLQEAMVALWKADPTRYDFDDVEDVDYLYRILVNRMLDVWDRFPKRVTDMEELHLAARIEGRRVRQ